VPEPLPSLQTAGHSYSLLTVKKKSDCETLQLWPKLWLRENTAKQKKALSKTLRKCHPFNFTMSKNIFQKCSILKWS